MSAVLIVGLVGFVCWLVTSDWRRERAQARWDTHVESIPVESNVRPISDAPGFDRITNLIAANEAARADWDEPAGWGDPA